MDITASQACSAKDEQAQLASELHKPARKNYPRRQTITFGIDDLCIHMATKGHQYVAS